MWLACVLDALFFIFAIAGTLLGLLDLDFEKGCLHAKIPLPQDPHDDNDSSRDEHDLTHRTLLSDPNSARRSVLFGERFTNARLRNRLYETAEAGVKYASMVRGAFNRKK